MEQIRVEKTKAGVDDGGRQRKKNCRSIKEQARLVAKHKEKDTRRRAMKTAKAASGATIQRVISGFRESGGSEEGLVGDGGEVSVEHLEEEPFVAQVEEETESSEEE